LKSRQLSRACCVNARLFRAAHNTANVMSMMWTYICQSARADYFIAFSRYI
jgi:hypothetical protein